MVPGFCRRVGALIKGAGIFYIPANVLAELSDELGFFKIDELSAMVAWLAT